MNEESPLLGKKHSSNEQGPVIVSRKSFLHQSAWLIIILTFAVTVTTVASVELWRGYYWGWNIPTFIYSVLWVSFTVIFLLTLHGLYIWNRGDLPLVKEEGAKYVTAADGRTVEYFVWGSEKTDAKITVVLHGSCATGKYCNQYLYPPKVLEEMNVKAISPSYPGHGGSDTHPFRRIADWPTTDLEPILRQEGVAKFLVQGTSYGTAHAMATAVCFPKRCVAMGLNVPYLPETICREFEYHTDADMVLTEAQMQKPWIILPILSLLSIFQGIVGKTAWIVPEGRKAKAANPELFQALEADVQRSFLRGVWGQSFEMLNSATNQHWQDPRTIETSCLAVWYAEDDSAVPPAHGEWLVNALSSEKVTETHTSIRHENKGLGHFSYMGQEDQDNAVMTRELLQLLSDEELLSNFSFCG
jgi:pimeloyl-ACP methyl ester carboxylesterase